MAATLTDPLIGHLVDGRYEVLSRIARGGMATVYLAVDRRLDREVALKVMHPHLAEGASGADFQARFRREARAAARLTHPGLVGVLDQGVDGETSYLAMEYVDGSNLRRRLTEEGPLRVGDALRTAESVLEALSVAHRAGLVHRDIKPENVLLARDGRVKVADFGLARAVTEATYTATGTVLGTVAYLAPELVARGASDPRSDVYAVGILLFEMLTGTQPYTGATPIQVAYQHVHSDIPAPSERVPWLPTEVDELVEALAAREPDERPVDAAAALTQVRRTLAALDDALLARSAERPPTPEAPPGEGDDQASPDDDAERDPDATELLGVGASATDGDDPLRRTIALKVRTAEITAPPPPDRAPRRRRRVFLASVVVLLLALAGGVGWWFLEGPGAYRQVPNLVGQAQADAEAALAQVGLTPAVTTDFHPEVPAGEVFATDPPAGEQVRREGTVTLFVSRGPDMRDVPTELVGKPFAEVEAALVEAGFTVPTPRGDWSDDVPADHVIAIAGPDGASLAEGGSLPKDTAISLVVSQGPAPIKVPNVIGAERQRAVAVLEVEFGLTVTVIEDYSDEQPAGMVAAQSLEPGSDAHRLDEITITVSLGPPLVEVPRVVGKQFSEAKAELEALGLSVTRSEVLGGYFGTVRAQSVEPGESVPKGTTVELVVV